MTSLKTVNRRVGSLFAVAALVLATVTPGLVPAFASAAQVTERSVQVSSSSAGAEGVEYKIGFKPLTAATAVVLDFCEQSPLVGSACTGKAGFDVLAATVSSPGHTKGTGDSVTAKSLFVTGTFATSGVEIVLQGVDNPTAAGPLYLRILTYTGAGAETAAADYTSVAPGDYEDAGGAAVSITDSIGVSAAVLESMTFCVAGAEIDGVNCTTTEPEGLAPPSVVLGEGTGSIKALSASAISQASIFSQISTNAVDGAVVSLKTSNACGGLKRPAPVTDCDIAAAGTDGLTAAGQPKFGLQVKSAADPAGDASVGTYQIYGTGGTPFYSDTVFKLNYTTPGTGVASTYGDNLLDTGDAPVNNKNVEIVFGASAANNTPAGIYSTDLSLIATGKF